MHCCVRSKKKREPKKKGEETTYARVALPSGMLAFRVITVTSSGKFARLALPRRVSIDPTEMNRRTCRMLFFFSPNIDDNNYRFVLMKGIFFLEVRDDEFRE